MRSLSASCSHASFQCLLCFCQRRRDGDVTDDSPSAAAETTAASPAVTSVPKAQTDVSHPILSDCVTDCGDGEGGALRTEVAEVSTTPGAAERFNHCATRPQTSCGSAATTTSTSNNDHSTRLATPAENAIEDPGTSKPVELQTETAAGFLRGVGVCEAPVGSGDAQTPKMLFLTEFVGRRREEREWKCVRETAPRGSRTVEQGESCRGTAAPDRNEREDSSSPRGPERQLTQDSSSPRGPERQLTQDSSSPRDLQQQLTQDSSSPRGLQQQLTQDSSSPRGLQQQLTQDSSSPRGLQQQLTQDSSSPRGLQQQLTQDSSESLADRIDTARRRCRSMRSDLTCLSTRCDSLFTELQLVRDRQASCPCRRHSLPAAAVTSLSPLNDAAKVPLRQSLPAGLGDISGYVPLEDFASGSDSFFVSTRAVRWPGKSGTSALRTSMGVVERVEAELSHRLDKLTELASSTDDPEALDDIAPTFTPPPPPLCEGWKPSEAEHLHASAEGLEPPARTPTEEALAGTGNPSAVATPLHDAVCFQSSLDFHTPYIQALTCLESFSDSGRLKPSALTADLRSLQSSMMVQTPPSSDCSSSGSDCARGGNRAGSSPDVTPPSSAGSAASETRAAGEHQGDLCHEDSSPSADRSPGSDWKRCCSGRECWSPALSPSVRQSAGALKKRESDRRSPGFARRKVAAGSDGIQDDSGVTYGAVSVADAATAVRGTEGADGRWGSARDAVRGDHSTCDGGGDHSTCDGGGDHSTCDGGGDYSTSDGGGDYSTCDGGGDQKTSDHSTSDHNTSDHSTSDHNTSDHSTSDHSTNDQKTCAADGREQQTRGLRSRPGESMSGLDLTDLYSSHSSDNIHENTQDPSSNNITNTNDNNTSNNGNNKNDNTNNNNNHNNNDNANNNTTKDRNASTVNPRNLPGAVPNFRTQAGPIRLIISPPPASTRLPRKRTSGQQSLQGRAHEALTTLGSQDRGNSTDLKAASCRRGWKPTGAAPKTVWQSRRLIPRLAASPCSSETCCCSKPCTDRKHDREDRGEDREDRGEDREGEDREDGGNDREDRGEDSEDRGEDVLKTCASLFKAAEHRTVPSSEPRTSRSDGSYVGPDVQQSFASCDEDHRSAASAVPTQSESHQPVKSAALEQRDLRQPITAAELEQCNMRQPITSAVPTSRDWHQPIAPTAPAPSDTPRKTGHRQNRTQQRRPELPVRQLLTRTRKKSVSVSEIARRMKQRPARGTSGRSSALQSYNSLEDVSCGLNFLRNPPSPREGLPPVEGNDDDDDDNNNNNTPSRAIAVVMYPCCRQAPPRVARIPPQPLSSIPTSRSVRTGRSSHVLDRSCPAAQSHVPDRSCPTAQSHVPVRSCPVAKCHLPHGSCPAAQSHVPHESCPAAQSHVPHESCPAAQSHVPDRSCPAAQSHVSDGSCPTSQSAGSARSGRADYPQWRQSTLLAVCVPDRVGGHGESLSRKRIVTFDELKARILKASRTKPTGSRLSTDRSETPSAENGSAFSEDRGNGMEVSEARKTEPARNCIAMDERESASASAESFQALLETRNKVKEIREARNTGPTGNCITTNQNESESAGNGQAVSDTLGDTAEKQNGEMTSAVSQSSSLFNVLSNERPADWNKDVTPSRTDAALSGYKDDTPARTDTVLSWNKDDTPARTDAALSGYKDDTPARKDTVLSWNKDYTPSRTDTALSGNKDDTAARDDVALSEATYHVPKTPRRRELSCILEDEANELAEERSEYPFSSTRTSSAMTANEDEDLAVEGLTPSPAIRSPAPGNAGSDRNGQERSASLSSEGSLDVERTSTPIVRKGSSGMFTSTPVVSCGKASRSSGSLVLYPFFGPNPPGDQSSIFQARTDTHTPSLCGTDTHTPSVCRNDTPTPSVCGNDTHTPSVCRNDTHTPSVCRNDTHTPSVCSEIAPVSTTVFELRDSDYDASSDSGKSSMARTDDEDTSRREIEMGTDVIWVEMSSSLATTHPTASATCTSGGFPRADLQSNLLTAFEDCLGQPASAGESSAPRQKGPGPVQSGGVEFSKASHRVLSRKTFVFSSRAAELEQLDPSHLLKSNFTGQVGETGTCCDCSSLQLRAELLGTSVSGFADCAQVGETCDRVGETDRSKLSRLRTAVNDKARPETQPANRHEMRRQCPEPSWTEENHPSSAEVRQGGPGGPERGQGGPEIAPRLQSRSQPLLPTPACRRPPAPFGLALMGVPSFPRCPCPRPSPLDPHYIPCRSRAHQLWCRCLAANHARCRENPVAKELGRDRRRRHPELWSTLGKPYNGPLSLCLYCGPCHYCGPHAVSKPEPARAETGRAQVAPPASELSAHLRQQRVCEGERRDRRLPGDAPFIPKRSLGPSVTEEPRLRVHALSAAGVFTAERSVGQPVGEEPRLRVHALSAARVCTAGRSMGQPVGEEPRLRVRVLSAAGVCTAGRSVGQPVGEEPRLRVRVLSAAGVSTAGRSPGPAVTTEPRLHELTPPTSRQAAPRPLPLPSPSSPPGVFPTSRRVATSPPAAELNVKLLLLVMVTVLLLVWSAVVAVAEKLGEAGASREPLCECLAVAVL